MSIEPLRENIRHAKEILREMYVFTNQLNIIKELESEGGTVIDVREKKLLNNAVQSLLIQFQLLNKTIPALLDKISFFKQLPAELEKKEIEKPQEKLIQVKYQPSVEQPKIAVTINEGDRQKFLTNLSRSNLSIHQLKKKYAVEMPVGGGSFGKPNSYARLSNKFFRNSSIKLAQKGRLNKLNKSLRRMNSPFVVTTYASIIFFTMMITFIVSIFLLVLLSFYHVSFIYPFLAPVEISFLARFINIFWIIFVFPIMTGILMYLFPSSEAKNLGTKINQELPFVAIHMSAISTSGIEPLNIFSIILKSKDYRYTSKEFRKLMNLVNFQGYDLVTALKKTANSSPSTKLRELLLLFDYKLEREKYTKTSETFMDIYISVVIAAPMILLILFVIMGSTGMNWLGLDVEIMGLLIIMIISLLNIGFLVFLKLKQPIF